MNTSWYKYIHMPRKPNPSNIPRHWDKIYNNLTGTKEEYEFMLSLSGMDKEANRKFFLYLTHTALARGRDAEIIVPQSTAADCLNRSINNISAMKEMYNPFRREVLDGIDGVFETATWDWNSKQCRVVQEFNLGKREDEYQKIVTANNYWSKRNDRVFLKDGTKATRERLAIVREEILNSVEISSNPYAAKIQSAIHAVEDRTYSNKLPHVIEEALSIVSRIKDPRARIPQEKYLRNIIRFPKGLLYPSRELRTDRIFYHGHWVNLTKDVRIAMNGDSWVEADLVSSQLAIAAKIWKIPFVYELLSDLLLSNISIWKYLQRQLGISESELETVKPIIKECVYSICFGKSFENLLKEIGDELVKCNATFNAKRLFCEQLFAELFIARNRLIKEIERTGEVRDAFGIPWPVVKSPKKAETHESIRSLMARVAQSWELLIISEAFNILGPRSNNKIVVFAHDGFTMTKENGFKKDCQEISRSVDAKLKELKIPSRLKWEI
jgi:hypothetical protein